MSAGRDPLGKRALFSGAPPTDDTPAQQSRKRGPFDVTVICSSCQTRTTLNAPDFILGHLPLGAWLPWRKHSHLMRCPACARITWHAVSLVW
jgi:hypothetical protein